MLKRLEETLKEIRKSKEFQEYKRKNKEAYLASALFIVEEGTENIWSADFYSPQKHLLTTFRMMGKKCERSQENEILQHEKIVLKELKMSDVETSLAHAFEIASESLGKEKGIAMKKIIVVLQEQKGAPIWNLTYLTANLDLVNIKINARQSSLISSHKVPLFKMP